jgi:hypothetical protein
MEGHVSKVESFSYIRVASNAIEHSSTLKFFLNLKMTSLQIDILNPKAEKILKGLADLNLIVIKKTKSDSFLKIVNKIRKKAKRNPISLEEISKEVESVRAKRYGKAN